MFSLKSVSFSFFIFMSSAFLLADIQPYLKKIQDKSDIHKMRNIDFIYMINLDQRPEKWKMSTDQLSPYGIYPYRFSAVNGWELSLEAINDIGLKYLPGMTGGFWATSYHVTDNFEPSHELIENYGQVYFCHCIARGTLGIVLSHLSILQDAYDSGYETIWVMEDDIEVLSDPTVIPTLIDRLDKIQGKGNWDMLFTDRDIRDANGNHLPSYGAARRPDFEFSTTLDFANKKQISKDFRKIESRFGATSVIYRRSGIEKILKFYKEHHVFHPYDMEFYAPPEIKPFTVTKDIISNLAKSISDNGGPNYIK